MKKGRLSKKGFTIIEVILFLAITSGLFAMVMTNMSSRVASRRYSSAIYDLAENLKDAYSATINVENYRIGSEYSSMYCSISSAFDNSGKLVKNSESDPEKGHDNYPGRTKCAVYGQIITFGENEEGNEINHYDIIGLVKTGDIEPTGDDDVLNSLGRDEGGVSANIVTLKSNDNGLCSITPAGNFSSFRTQWDITIENKNNGFPFKGAVMIARSPISGTIHTFIYRAYNFNGDLNEEGDDTFDVQRKIAEANKTNLCGDFKAFADDFLIKGIKEEDPVVGRWVRMGEDGSESHLDVCLGSEDLYAVGNKRRAIRIHGDGSTEAAIEVMSEVDSYNICKGGNPS